MTCLGTLSKSSEAAMENRKKEDGKREVWNVTLLSSLPM